MRYSTHWRSACTRSRRNCEGAPCSCGPPRPGIDPHEWLRKKNHLSGVAVYVWSPTVTDPSTVPITSYTARERVKRPFSRTYDGWSS